MTDLDLERWEEKLASYEGHLSLVTWRVAGDELAALIRAARREQQLREALTFWAIPTILALDPDEENPGAVEAARRLRNALADAQDAR